MNASTESLKAFAHAASSGSFSEAARKLGKSQSTISEAIARLELDTGVELFQRHTRRLVLTDAGASLLDHAEAILAAVDRFSRQANTLSRGEEARLTLALSDAYQQNQYEARLTELDERYPQLEFECLIAERVDVLDLVRQGRAHLGLLAAQHRYPPDIAHARTRESTEFGLFVSRTHALTETPRVDDATLQRWRALRLSSVAASEGGHDDMPASGTQCWAAPDYLLLLEMAALGFGWAALPKPLVNAYGQNRLAELTANGWPRHVAVDVVWSRQRDLGPAAAWLLDRLLA
ncbi:LysR family transcriptional regulator [Pseudomonas matsuisoli]|uniref:LysR family transcriptional regulator n=1 Tax=Pseudomonas matsuisoli TaxID=1515666 RepID=A0A917Q0N3_9PSED|nr:LysR family transcriptional regulator [Pseudomonas matsuisoli]GGK03922.1 LysR family transcriptional regulator [Pseudomonas matsuisoli]